MTYDGIRGEFLKRTKLACSLNSETVVENGKTRPKYDYVKDLTVQEIPGVRSDERSLTVGAAK